tara:strand:- start:6428 stop:6859 length:432 start_codon:yes stop_codon:yes gene_type:complete
MNNINFNPQLTPKEMLKLGIFGGYYFEGKHNEYPKDWFKDAKLSNKGYDVNLNYFKIRSGQSRDEWNKKGWITKEDPLGWFQWYCRYTMGRRLAEIDNFQISRWAAFGPRHIGGIKTNCEPGNIDCRPRQRQALLHWAYDPFI